MKRKDGEVTAEGIFYTTEDRARSAAEALDKDVTKTDEGWLAQNRQTQKGSMPTRVGDVIVRHVNQRWDVWQVANDNEQMPAFVATNPQVGLRVVWSKSDAEDIVRELSPVTVFWLQHNEEWVRRPWSN